MQSHHTSSIAFALIAVAAFWFSYVLFALGRDARLESARILAWPSTEGVVVKTSLHRERIRRLNLLTSNRQPRHQYSSTIAYEYSVNGRSYLSNSIGQVRGLDRIMGKSRGEFGGAYEASWLSKYPEGKRVNVFYDPADPSTAVLERDAGWISILYFSLSALVALMGCILVSSAKSQWSRS